MAHKTLFYYRDLAFLETLKEDWLPDYIETLPEMPLD
jgi:hypothetical protein